MKIICVGRNYSDHINELNNEKPQNPVLFMKPDTALMNTEMPFPIPEFSDNVQYEAEIVVKINKTGKHIQPEFAHKYYDKIALGIDFTARDTQQYLKEKGLPWEKAKAFDNSAVVSDFFPKENYDLQNLSFTLQCNQQVVQSGNTKDMLWKTDELIAYISTYFTLKTGDMIFTGTPAGVGKINSGDKLEGFLEDKKVFDIKAL
ncbi:fumarylacetoacetate hydrolase family protein [Avrilella dinanensis]|uniref:2-hydroxyhepta-2,4-diene-1,7-dioate isomerase n=1 Tax=Avrilella dinanensis TaxID=2008672 RepID=A0A2M9R4F7_9FLAO|nr:fumarylacetoacetate hydrolase family protein [Avrilella dinanensis]PJR03625.1 2-hydroxyhepta-2,4-diene-1,7-dioate isomerase [Avrilella dinanensis]